MPVVETNLYIAQKGSFRKGNTAGTAQPVPFPPANRRDNPLIRAYYLYLTNRYPT